MINLYVSGENESFFDNIIIEDIETGDVDLLYVGGSGTSGEERAGFGARSKSCSPKFHK